MTLTLLFLGGENQNDLLTITLAAAIVLAVRVAAYFDQPTSHDLAKTLPLGLLAVILVRSDLFENLANRLTLLEDRADLVGTFFVVVVIVEFTLNALWHVYQAIRPHRPAEPQVAVERARGPTQ